MKKLFVLGIGLLLIAGVYVVRYYEPAAQSAVQSVTVETESELRSRLTPLQYAVTQENATEQAYNNEYWDTHEDGIYVDVVSGVALFSSTNKYDSKTGWPSFTQPIDEAVLAYVEDQELGFERTEVRSAKSDAHLGHVFTDGPEDAGGRRFCMNSAALRFVPRAELAAKGYAEYERLFANQ